MSRGSHDRPHSALPKRAAVAHRIAGADIICRDDWPIPCNVRSQKIWFALGMAEKVKAINRMVKHLRMEMRSVAVLPADNLNIPNHTLRSLSGLQS